MWQLLPDRLRSRTRTPQCQRTSRPARRARPRLEALEDRIALITDLTTPGAFAAIENGAFVRQANPSNLSGEVDVFLGLHRNGHWEDGYNTNGPYQLDTQPGSRAIRLGEIPIVHLDGVAYREFVLDINEPTSDPQRFLAVDNIWFYVSSSPTLTGYNRANHTLAGLSPVYEFDSGRVLGVHIWIKLDGNLNSSSWGDMILYVPSAVFGTDPNQFVYMYSLLGHADGAYAEGGVEQWGIGRNATPVSAVGEIHGLKFNDLNGNGIRDAGEPGLAGVTIFLDANNNGVLDAGEAARVTDANGNYSFTNLGAGTFRVREVVPPGWLQTTSNPDLVCTGTNVFTGVNFGNVFVGFSSSSISGVKFNDLNGNGVRDAGEPGLAGVTIFLDANNNGVLDAGEVSRVTDASGSYSFTNLPAGTFRVREVVPPGWVQTTLNPADLVCTGSNVFTGVNFGNLFVGFSNSIIAGVKFHDVNGNGVRDAGEPGLGGWTIFLDTNNNGVRDAGEAFRVTDSNGDYSFTNLPAGTYVVREEPQAGWEQTTPNPVVVVCDGSNAVGVNFGNRLLPAFDSIIRGTKFHDLNRNGVRDADELGLGGWTIFLDANDNGVLDAGEAFRITDGNGDYSFTGLGAGTFVVREVQQAGWEQTTSNPVIVVCTGRDEFIVNIGNLLVSGTTIIVGTKFHDLNRNGVRDAGEPGLPGVTIFLDQNNNGILDPGEASRVTDAGGLYFFTNLGAGLFRVREVVPAGWVQTSANPDLLSTGANLFTDVNFGNVRLISISGSVFFDLTGDQVQNPGEPSLANVIVFLDANGNGLMDEGEVRTVTGADGSYSFTNLAPGLHRVRVLLPPDWEQTTPADILATDADVSGVHLGVRIRP